MNQQSRPCVRLSSLQHRVEERLYVVLFLSALFGLSLSGFGVSSLPLPPPGLGAFGFGLVRLKRADGAVRVAFFLPGCWLEGLAVCGRSLYAAGFNGVWCLWAAS